MTAQVDAGIEEWTRAGETVLAFRGPFSQDMLVDLGLLIRNRLRASKHGKAIFAVFAELAQNIQRYSADRGRLANREDSVGIGAITLVEKDGQFELCAENKIHQDEQPRLKARLSRLQKMDRGELISAYKRQRKVGLEPSPKGAGLGLFEIARRSNEPPLFSFQDLDSAFASVTLTVKIGKQDA